MPEERREPKCASRCSIAAHGGPRRTATPPAGGKEFAMYSIFYIIGVIVVILAVLQLIA
jgi:hypothetical protein